MSSDQRTHLTLKEVLKWAHVHWLYHIRYPEAVSFICPSKGAVWKKHTNRMGCHHLGMKRWQQKWAHLPPLQVTQWGILCFISLLLEGSIFLLEDIARVPLNLCITATTKSLWSLVSQDQRAGRSVIILEKVIDPDHRRS